MAKKTESTSSDRFRRGDGTSDRIAKGDSRSRRKSVFKGVSVVPGIAMGTVRLKFRQTQVLSDQSITFKDVEREYERLNEAVRLSKEQLLEARAKVQKEIGELEAMIFDAHLAILEDQGFLKKIRAQVQALLKPVEVVFLRDGGTVSTAPVKRGISDENYTEIIEGLQEGQEVVSGGYKAISRDLEDGKKVKLGDPEKEPEEKK